MKDWAEARKAAAWYIRAGRALRASHGRFSGHISRADNNAVFKMGWDLVQVGQRVAMGYLLENWTPEIYRAHLRATRPKRKRRCCHCGKGVGS